MTLSWVPPTQNDDGSPLTDLAGYKVYYNNNSSMSQNQVKDVPGASSTTTTIGPLAAGTWYAIMSAYNSQGVESAKVPSPPVSKTLSAGPSISHTVKVTFPQAPTNVEAR